MKSLKEEIESLLSSPVSKRLPERDPKSIPFVETMRKAGIGALKGEELAPLIDHTLLKADATRNEIEKLCREAITQGFASVCVNPGRIPEAVAFLNRFLDSTLSKNTPPSKTVPLPIAVVGFPLGATSSTSKAAEARDAITAGAREIDMVLNIGLMKDRDYEGAESDIRTVVEAAGPIPVKVILETVLLSDEEKKIACLLAQRAGARFVKTSTGFSSSGAIAKDVVLMREVVGFSMGVKASGGIRTRADALRMIAAGADRIGASASVAICSDDATESPPSSY
jgi:deoxyribose-phosphate aldolase